MHLDVGVNELGVADMQARRALARPGQHLGRDVNPGHREGSRRVYGALSQAAALLGDA